MVMIFRWRGGVQKWPPAMRLFRRWIFNEHMRHISTTVCFQTCFWWRLCNADMNFVRTVFGGFFWGCLVLLLPSDFRVPNLCHQTDLIGIWKESKRLKVLWSDLEKQPPLRPRKRKGPLVFQSYLVRWTVFFFGFGGSKYLLSFGVTGCLGVLFAFVMSMFLKGS